MCDQHQCRTGFTVHPEQQVDNGFSGMLVKVTGWLIGKQNRWADDKGPCDGDPLLLAAG